VTTDSHRRGTAWVVGQFVLLALIVAHLFVGDGITPLGWVVAAVGLVLALWAARTMGESLSPFPRPPRRAQLVERGPFRFLRHPIYVGGTLFLVGLSLVFSLYALALTVLLAVFWFFKARVEERYLAERFPEYGEYRRRTLF
jgi:protein-S-isoprenylcysteine O-methyltransferase Ste14